MLIHESVLVCECVLVLFSLFCICRLHSKVDCFSPPFSLDKKRLSSNLPTPVNGSSSRKLADIFTGTCIYLHPSNLPPDSLKQYRRQIIAYPYPHADYIIFSFLNLDAFLKEQFWYRIYGLFMWILFYMLSSAFQVPEIKFSLFFFTWRYENLLMFDYYMEPKIRTKQTKLKTPPKDLNKTIQNENTLIFCFYESSLWCTWDTYTHVSQLPHTLSITKFCCLNHSRAGCECGHCVRFCWVKMLNGLLNHCHVVCPLMSKYKYLNRTLSHTHS